MLICPKCKNEYQKGYKICSDYNEELIEIPYVVEKGINHFNMSMLKEYRIYLILL